MSETQWWAYYFLSRNTTDKNAVIITIVPLSIAYTDAAHWVSAIIFMVDAMISIEAGMASKSGLKFSLTGLCLCLEVQKVLTKYAMRQRNSPKN